MKNARLTFGVAMATTNTAATTMKNNTDFRYKFIKSKMDLFFHTKFIIEQ